MVSETAAVPIALPASLSSRLEKVWSRNTSELNRQRMEPCDFNKAVLEEVVDGMVWLLGEF